MTNYQRANVNDFEEKWRESSRNSDTDIARIMTIAYMAENDIYPDGSFSDNECIIWGAFHRYKV